jgi:hypothetical protein
MAHWNDEGRLAVVELSCLVAVEVYFPCDSGQSPESTARRTSFTDQFGRILRNVAKRCRKAGKALLVCGDLNAVERGVDAGLPAGTEYDGPGGRASDRRVFECLRDAKCVDAYVAFNGADCPDGNHLTWEGTDNAFLKRMGIPRRQRLDYVWKTEVGDVLDCRVLHELKGGSDHCPVSVTLGALPSAESCLPSLRVCAAEQTELRSAVIPLAACGLRTAAVTVKAALRALEAKDAEERTVRRVDELHKALLAARIRTSVSMPCPRVVLGAGTGTAKVTALLDTGARMSLIRPEVAKRMFPKARRTEASLKVALADGSCQVLKERLSASLRWGGRRITLPLYVMDGMPVDLLIGWDNIRAKEIDILHDDRAVLNAGGDPISLPTVLHTEYNGVLAPVTLTTVNDIVVPPGALAVGVAVSIGKIRKQKEWKGEVQGVVDGGERACVISLRKGKGIMPMWNPSSQPMRVKRGTALAVFVPHTGVVQTRSLQKEFAKQTAAHVMAAGLPRVLRECSVVSDRPWLLPQRASCVFSASRLTNRFCPSRMRR